MNKLLQNTILGIIVVSILGTLFHFVYHLSGQNAFVGLFVPVNESTWEHMKLVFFPMLIFFLADRKFSLDLSFSKENINILTSLAGTCFIPVLFYTYTGILGTHYAVLDIATFYISVILAFLMRYLLLNNKKQATRFREEESHTSLLLSAVLLAVVVSFLIFTYYPLSLGIFQPPVS